MPATPPTDAQRVQQRRAVGFVLMSALLPGSVQSYAGNRRLGRLASRVFGGAVALLILALVGMVFARASPPASCSRPGSASCCGLCCGSSSPAGRSCWSTPGGSPAPRSSRGAVASG
ncbi:hypothetical protein G7085_16615 [Tessaracoccus sp. HDW20]|uniref:hypothetical protein n=1 Tax=Tessaracoccus coleopterorum TaxID=2714950 RepID=UPI0018D341A7|nr:hypothetical protein [Tessaracoccus coleopterorum]NHB85670.1 hypothetical protein [Tessaracoccus coleopterorum]